MFYDLFKSLCDENGVSVSRACIEMGLSRSIAAKWKNTRTNPSAEVLPKIAKYFGVTTDYLLTGEQKEKAPTPVSESGPLYPPGYDLLTPEQKEIVDRLIADLARNHQSGG